MQNAEEVHVTGTGTSQEQLMRYIAGTPQFKNIITKEKYFQQNKRENVAEYIAANLNTSIN